jgi:hypothetical protein
MNWQLPDTGDVIAMRAVYVKGPFGNASGFDINTFAVRVAGAALSLSDAESHAGVPSSKLSSSSLSVPMPPFVMSTVLAGGDAPPLVAENVRLEVESWMSGLLAVKTAVTVLFPFIVILVGLTQPVASPSHLT